MAPEQAAGRKDLTIAADVYSLGAILYELLTGRAPFQAEHPIAVIRLVLESEPASPRSLQANIDRDLETICLKCLEKDPGRRYPSAEALAEDLDRWLRGEPIAARPSTSWERLRKWAQRKPAVAALTGVSAAAVVLVLGLVLGFTVELQETIRQLNKALGMFRMKRSRKNARPSSPARRNSTRKSRRESREPPTKKPPSKPRRQARGRPTCYSSRGFCSSSLFI